MKYRRRTRIGSGFISVKLAVILIVIIAIEAVMGFTLFFNAEKVAVGGISGGYVKEINRVAEKFDLIIQAGYETSPDFTGGLTDENDATIIIDGGNYTAAENIARNLRAGGVTFYTLYELCDNDSADEFITGDLKVYAVYSTPVSGGTVNLKFKDASEMIHGLDFSGFGGFAVISESRRVVVIRDAEAEVLIESGVAENVEKAALLTDGIKEGLNYRADFSDGVAVSVEMSGGVYIAVLKGLSAAGYSLLGYADFTETAGAVTGLKKQIVLTFAIIFAVTCGAIALIYKSVAETDEDKQVKFPKKAPPENMTMKEFYDSFSDRKTLLVGEILFANLRDIETVFGREFTEKVRNILLERIKEKFSLFFQFDYFRLGVITADGKEIKTFLRDVKEIVASFNKAAKIDDNHVLVRVKCGFALGDEAMQSHDYDYVTAAAEAALKRATEESETDIDRRDYFIYRETQRKFYSKYLFKINVKKMLADGDFYLEYQPQYNVRLNKVSGFEALLRVKERAKVSATVSEIINYAEQSGDMVLLGDFIFNEGMKFAKSIEGTGATVSLNVSLIQLMQTGFVDNFLKLYRFYDLKAGALCLEITESYFVQTIDETLKKLRILNEHGINIHLDDFGKAYSSFNYLQKLPISAIKIDKTFVRDIEKNRYSEFITKTIIDISNSLNLKSICEGVETEEQLKIVSSYGCETVQGFLISRSVDENTARDMIKNYSYGTNFR